MERVQKRLLNISESPPGNLHICIETKTMGQGFLKELADTLENYPDTGLIIIDILQKIRDYESTSASDLYGREEKEMSAIKSFADRRGIGIVCVTHLKKMQDRRDPVNEILGSTAMSGVYLVYELATPTTELATPYANPQTIALGGVEEFVDYGKYGIVDLGSLDWTYNSEYTFFHTTDISTLAKKPTDNNTVANIYTSKYTTVTRNALASNKQICMTNTGTLVIEDTAYTDATIFKAALNGVYLIYELATPNRDVAVSVGNNTKSYANSVIEPIVEYIDNRVENKLGKEDSSRIIVNEDNNDYTLQVNAYGNVAMMRLQFKQQKTYNDWAYVKSWSYAVPFSLMALSSDSTSGNIFVTADGVQARGGTYKQNSVYTQSFLIG